MNRLSEIKQKISEHKLRLLELSEWPKVKGWNREKTKINIKLDNLYRAKRYLLAG